MESVTIQPHTDVARAAAYKTLCWGFIYPTAERWPEWSDWKTALHETFSMLGVSADDVLTAADALPTNEDGLTRLQVMYTKCFINAIPKVVAPPYASAYGDGGQLMGRPAEDAIRAYRQAGLEFSTSMHELPDHIAAELEFLYYLGHRTLEADESGDDALKSTLHEQQRRFLHDHMLLWVPSWRKRLSSAEHASFYRALAQLTESWLRRDAVYLNASREREPQGVNQ